MSENPNKEICVIIGASHAGVSCAFSLRREGWEGDIIVYDSDPVLPYHRPPLSKTCLSSEVGTDKHHLKASQSYIKERISLKLGVAVTAIHKVNKVLELEDGTSQVYDKLVLATGARPILPSIPGLGSSDCVFPLRTAADVNQIRNSLSQSRTKRVVVIGGGYIGLETAASLRKLGAQVTVLEREERILIRVTAPEMSMFFEKLHADNGVEILASKNVTAINAVKQHHIVVCDDGSKYNADIIIIGVGIQVNEELANMAGLKISNGIQVDTSTKTNDDSIYAIGDCSYHYNAHYDRYIRLESVQNAVDQAKVAAATICGKKSSYDCIPWFWSDQYDTKLQIVGLSDGYDQILVRNENGTEKCFSIWYFKGDRLLAVDAINNSKAYVYGTKFIKSGDKLNKSNLMDSKAEFKPANLLAH